MAIPVTMLVRGLVVVITMEPMKLCNISTAAWRWYAVIDHPRRGVVCNFGRVCMYVCLSDDNFRRASRRTFIFAHVVYLRGIRVDFVYVGHRIKVKVTRAKEIENSYSRNVKLLSAITSVLSNIEPGCLRAARDFRVRRIEWCNRHLCYVTGSEHA